MPFLRRRTQLAAVPKEPSFGEWALRSFARETDVRDMTFSQLEQVCANAASLLCGAIFAAPGDAADLAPDIFTARGEADLVAKRTADGFKAALADRQHTILAWPWDHLGTRVAWQATQQERVATAALGDELLRIAAGYVTAHREQARIALDLWEQVARGLRPESDASAPSLVAMGAQALATYRSAREGSNSAAGGV
ncbi:MAG: hypothetical protein IT303_08360 [Dehalococcoidia bacterium]|nr:hypothetical protein [Dehalococcoidia bacterium]